MPRSRNVVICSDGTGNTFANWYPNLGHTGEFVRGQWHHLEVVLLGNTSGNADGAVDWWLDGIKIGSYSGIEYIPGDNARAVVSPHENYVLFESTNPFLDHARGAAAFPSLLTDFGALAAYWADPAHAQIYLRYLGPQ
jgi:hypothetical protein